MKKKDLEFVKAVRTQIESGISKPLDINKAFQLIAPLENQESPMRAKITKIQWFMTFNYDDYLLEACNDLLEIDTTYTIDVNSNSMSVGDTDNHSHKEDIKVDDNLMDFLTSDEKLGLKSESTGTDLVVPKRVRRKK